MATAVDKENAVLGRGGKSSRPPLSPTRKPGTPLASNGASARSIDEGPALAPVPRPDERLTAAKRGAHVVVPLGLAPDAELIKLRNALINEQEDKKQYVLEYERIQEEGRALFTTYVAKCNRLKEVSAEAARLKQELTERSVEVTATRQRMQEEVARLNGRVAEEASAAQEARAKCVRQADDFRANFAAFRALKEENEQLKAELVREREEGSKGQRSSKEVEELRAALAQSEAQRKEAKDSADLAMVLARDRAARLEGLEGMQRAAAAKAEAALKYLNEQLRERDALHAAAVAQAEADKRAAERRAEEAEERLRSAEAEFKLAEGLFTSTHEEQQAALVAAQTARAKADDEALAAVRRAAEAERVAQEEKSRRDESVARLEAEREARQRAEAAAEERLAAARAQLESAEANLQRITAHANERVRSAAELLESEQAKARDREAEQTAIIATIRAELEKERTAGGARIADTERKFAQLQRHTRSLLADKEKAVKELGEAVSKAHDSEAQRVKAEEALKTVRERVQALEAEVTQLRQRAAGASANFARAQEAAAAAAAEAETLRLEAENCRGVLARVQRECDESVLSRDILANERAQLVVQLEVMLIVAEASGDLPPSLLRLAADHFALQRDQAALQSKCETAVREAERLRRELLRLARHARPTTEQATAAPATKV